MLLPSGWIVGAARTDILGAALAAAIRTVPAGTRIGSRTSAAAGTNTARPSTRRASRSATGAGAGSSGARTCTRAARSTCTSCTSCLRVGETDRCAGKQRTHGH